MKKQKNHTIAFCDNSLRELINFRLPVMESFINSGYHVVAIAPENRKIPEIGKGFKYINIKLSRGGMNPLKDLLYLITLIRIYRREKISCVFHYTIKPNIYGTLAARMLGIRSTMMIAGLGYVFTASNIGGFIGRNMYRFAARFADNVLVLNRDNYNLLYQRGIVKREKMILLEGGEGLDLSKY